MILFGLQDDTTAPAEPETTDAPADANNAGADAGAAAGTTEQPNSFLESID